MAEGQQKYVFITGQQAECTQDRFDKFYKPAIVAALDQNYAVVLGAADRGVDAMAAALLQEKHAEGVTVYDKGEKTGNDAKAKGWKLVNGFESYPARDDAMILKASKIIVYLFENAATSGTWRNLTAFAMSAIIPARREYYPDILLNVARTCTRDAPYCDTTWKISCSEDRKIDLLFIGEGA